MTQFLQAQSILVKVSDLAGTYCPAEGCAKQAMPVVAQQQFELAQARELGLALHLTALHCSRIRRALQAIHGGLLLHKVTAS